MIIFAVSWIAPIAIWFFFLSSFTHIFHHSFKMLGTLRRFGVSNVLRASAPRTFSTRWASQLPKVQAPSASSVLTRSLHSSFPKFSAAVAQESAETEPSQKIEKFAELGEQGFIDTTIIKNITHPSRMNLETMTEVQSMTLREIVKGNDV